MARGCAYIISKDYAGGYEVSLFIFKVQRKSVTTIKLDGAILNLCLFVVALKNEFLILI